MVMDNLRSCYQTEMRFFHDSDIKTPVIWYFAAPGAKRFPVPHRFGARQWEDGTTQQGHLGEVARGHGTYSKGQRSPIMRGQHFCGSIEQFQQGTSFVTWPGTPQRDRNGVPECCHPRPGGWFYTGTGTLGQAAVFGDVDSANTAPTESSVCGDVDSMPVVTPMLAVAGDVDSARALVVLNALAGDVDSAGALEGQNALAGDVDGAYATGHLEGVEQASDLDSAGDAALDAIAGDVDQVGDLVVSVFAGDVDAAGDLIVNVFAGDVDSSPTLRYVDAGFGDVDSSFVFLHATIAGDVDGASTDLPESVSGDVDSALSPTIVPAIAGDADSANASGLYYCYCCNRLVSGFLRAEVFDCVGAYIGTEGFYWLEYTGENGFPECGEYRGEFPFGHAEIICGEDIPSGDAHAFLAVTDDLGGDQVRSSSTYSCLDGTYARFGSAGPTVPLHFGIGACSIRIRDPLYP